MEIQPLHLKDPAGRIERIFVEESCLELPYVREILGRADGLPVARVAGHLPKTLTSLSYPKGLRQGKRLLYLGRNRGRFLKSCPATRHYRCCDYQVLNIGMNCPMDCVYCILQAYLNNPWLSFHVNVDELLAELDAALAMEPRRFLRIGTGEFTDSLALDSLTGLSRILVAYMRDQPQAVLELKTKTAAIDNLENLAHGGRTIVAWSLNAGPVITREELHTASLTERLAAASNCAAWGYRLAFHFDPLIHYPGWREDYRETVRLLFQSVPAEAIAWISLGALRFLPALRPIAFGRFPRSRFLREEFITGLDGKSRYFRSLRVELYRFLFEELSRHAHGRTCIYLCMESDEIWREVFGYAPEERGGLPAMLDRAASGG